MKNLGIYLRQRPQDFHGFAKFLVDHGFTTAVIESTNGPWLRRVDALKQAGLRVGISRFPHAWPFDEGLHDMLVDARECGMDLLCVDAEGQYAKNAQRRKAFADAVHECDLEADIVFTSYPSFPAKDFVREGWGATVQTYDRFDDQPLTFVARHLKRWQTLGFTEVFPSLGTFRLDRNDPTKATVKPIARFRQYLGSVPTDVTDAWFWTLVSFQRDWQAPAFRAHWDALRAFAK